MITWSFKASLLFFQLRSALCDWSCLGSACFQYFPQDKSYENAQKACIEADGVGLASIHSAEENDFVQQLIEGGSACSENTPYVWIGLNDKDEEGQYVWTDQSDVRYTNWCEGCPADAYAHNDVVGMLTEDVEEFSVGTYKKGTWRDIWASDRHCFVCSRSQGIPKSSAQSQPQSSVSSASEPKGDSEDASTTRSGMLSFEDSFEEVTTTMKPSTTKKTTTATTTIKVDPWYCLEGEDSGDLCYKYFFEEPLEFDEANKMCKDQGGAGLASIHAKEQNDLVYHLVTEEKASGGTFVWIGLKGTGSGASWTDVSTYGWKSWYHGSPEPNEKQGTAMSVNSVCPGWWFTRSLTNEMTYICGKQQVTCDGDAECINLPHGKLRRTSSCKKPASEDGAVRLQSVSPSILFVLLLLCVSRASWH